jgi:pimeloyl-ACP methyl ester carboxylesterase
MPRPTPSSQRPNAPQAPLQVVDPRWVAKAFAVTVLTSILCGYLSLCLLFYLGQWQIALHPVRTTSAQPPVPGAELLHFAPDDSAVPQLTGWWIPAHAGTRHTNLTLLYLPSGDGSLANPDSTATLAALHSLGINILAIDYRGYGQSAPTPHPSQQILTQDAESAWQYLRTSRNLPETSIIPYGVGVGATLATHLAATHPQTPALILQSPINDLLDTALRDDRTKLVPARLLFKERFPLTAPLSTLTTPKLLLSVGPTPVAYRTAASPKLTVALNGNPSTLAAQPEYLPSITRLLDEIHGK